jgi:Flp pilus assembly protein TadD
VRAAGPLLLLLAALLSGCGRSTPAERQGELNPESRMRVGEAAERAGDKATAIAMYTAAAHDAPDDVAVQLAAASGLARAGKWNQARDLMVERVKSHPNNPDLLRMLASIYVMVGQSEAAIARFDQVLALAPNDIQAMADKGVALDLLGRHGEAQALYRRALAIAPNDPIVSNDLALSLLMEGRAPAALAVLQPFAEADGVPDRLKINLGVILAANGRTEQAHRLLDGRVTPAELETLTRALTRGRPAPPGAN